MLTCVSLFLIVLKIAFHTHCRLIQLGQALFLKQDKTKVFNNLVGEAIFKRSDDEVVDRPSGGDDGGGEDESLACTLSASPLSEPTPNTKAEAVLIAAGRVLALSWYRKEPLGFTLSPAMCKLLLGRADLIEWNDLSAVVTTRQFRSLEECMAAKLATNDDAEEGATGATEISARTGAGTDAEAAGGGGGGVGGSIDPTTAAAAAVADAADALDRVALFAKFKMFVLAQTPTTEQHFVLPSRAAQRAEISGSGDGVDTGDSEAAIVTAIRKAKGNPKPRLTLSELLATATNGAPSASSTTAAAAAVAFREDSAFYDGGEEMMVTASNVDAFVHAWTVKELVTNTAEQIKLMQQGIAQVQNPSSETLNLLSDGDGGVCVGELGDEGLKQFQKAFVWPKTKVVDLLVFKVSACWWVEDVWQEVAASLVPARTIVGADCAHLFWFDGDSCYNGRRQNAGGG